MAWRIAAICASVRSTGRLIDVGGHHLELVRERPALPARLGHLAHASTVGGKDVPVQDLRVELPVVGEARGHLPHDPKQAGCRYVVTAVDRGRADPLHQQAPA